MKVLFFTVFCSMPLWTTNTLGINDVIHTIRGFNRDILNRGPNTFVFIVPDCKHTRSMGIESMIDVLSCTSTVTQNEKSDNPIFPKAPSPEHGKQQRNSNNGRQDPKIKLRTEQIIKNDKHKFLRRWNILLEIPRTKLPLKQGGKTQ